MVFRRIFLIGVADMTEERKETFEEEINQSERIDADEEPLSRMSRKASRQSKQKQKQKQKPRQERGESTVKDKLASVWAAINRYCGFAFSILKSPAKTVVTDGFSHYKYGLISMLIFSIIFSIGNWFQLKASWNRPLGFGERHHAFYDGFLVVLVYLLIFFAVMVFAIWAVSRYMMKHKVTFREAAAVLGSLLVPVIAVSILWLIFAIVNVPMLTVLFTVLILFSIFFIIALYVQRVYQAAQDAPIDYIYCVFAVVAIALLFTAVTWPFISEYFTASLIPL
ncbi:putative integral inner membrane protein [Bacillus subtilis XF-1]|nr:putative integral inner membrane protein [Bacillus subtilis XF-1]